MQATRSTLSRRGRETPQQKMRGGVYLPKSRLSQSGRRTDQAQGDQVPGGTFSESQAPETPAHAVPCVLPQGHCWGGGGDTEESSPNLFSKEGGNGLKRLLE